MVTSNAATGYVAKISKLRLNIGSGMLRLSSCMLRFGLRLRLRLSIGSCVLRLGLRLSFRESGGQPLPLKLSLSLSPSLSMHDPMLSLSPSLSMHEPLLSLSMLVLDPNHLD